MYNEEMAKFADRPIEIVPDMLGSDMAAGIKRQDGGDDEDTYQR